MPVLNDIAVLVEFHAGIFEESGVGVVPDRDKDTFHFKFGLITGFPVEYLDGTHVAVFVGQVFFKFGIPNRFNLWISEGTVGHDFRSAQLIAAMTGLPRPGRSVSDPCSGTAGLAIAMVRAMRVAGRAPELVHWQLQDLDGLAVALAGIQMAAHGIPHVTLTHGNTLAQAAS